MLIIKWGTSLLHWNVCLATLCILFVRVIGHLYSALLWDEPIAYSAQIWPVITKGSHSFTCHPHTNHTCCMYSPAAEWLALLAPIHGGMIGLSWPGWLVIYCDRFSHTGSRTLDTVTHPSNNQARHSVALLTETNALPLSQTAACNDKLWWLL